MNLIPKRDFLVDGKGKIIKWLNPFISEEDGRAQLILEAVKKVEAEETKNLLSDYFETLTLGVQIFFKGLQNELTHAFQLHDLDSAKNIISTYPFQQEHEIIRDKLFEFLKIEIANS